VFTLITDGAGMAGLYAPAKWFPQINFHARVLLTIPQRPRSAHGAHERARGLAMAHRRISGFIAGGGRKRSAAAIPGTSVYFVNQGQLGVAAFETSVLEARTFATIIDKSL
jgi:hypothetical protein